MDRCILTAASNRFFPSLLNFLGSIKANYPNHPKIYVYSLDLLSLFKNEIRQIENVELIEMPHFCKFWRKCYTWKPYIFAHPKARLNLFLDSGNQVLKPLDEMFDQIEQRDYFTVAQGENLNDIIPREYQKLFDLNKAELINRQYFASGIFGFKHPSQFDGILQKLFDLAQCGLCLGFSKSEQNRNKDVNETFFIRGCQTFRHEQTLLNILCYQKISDLFINPMPKYAGWQSKQEHPEQLIWNIRRHYERLEYANQLFQKNIKLKTLILNTFIKIRNLKIKYV